LPPWDSPLFFPAAGASVPAVLRRRVGFADTGGSTSGAAPASAVGPAGWSTSPAGASAWASPRRRRNGVRNLRPRPRAGATLASPPAGSVPADAAASLVSGPNSSFMSLIFFLVLRMNLLCFFRLVWQCVLRIRCANVHLAFVMCAIAWRIGHFLELQPRQRHHRVLGL